MSAEVPTSSNGLWLDGGSRAQRWPGPVAVILWGWEQELSSGPLGWWGAGQK